MDFDESGIQKTLLCFNDISQKILYDVEKAEGELLTLINSTVSHEMRNPLNSILNQCEIMGVLLNQLVKEISHNSSANIARDKSKLLEIKSDIENSNKI